MVSWGRASGSCQVPCWEAKLLRPNSLPADQRGECAGRDLQPGGRGAGSEVGTDQDEGAGQCGFEQRQLVRTGEPWARWGAVSATKLMGLAASVAVAASTTPSAMRPRRTRFMRTPRAAAVSGSRPNGPSTPPARTGGQVLQRAPRRLPHRDRPCPRPCITHHHNPSSSSLVGDVAELSTEFVEPGGRPPVGGPACEPASLGQR